MLLDVGHLGPPLVNHRRWHRPQVADLASGAARRPVLEPPLPVDHRLAHRLVRIHGPRLPRGCDSGGGGAGSLPGSLTNARRSRSWSERRTSAAGVLTCPDAIPPHRPHPLDHLDTVGVAGSSPVSSTRKAAGQRPRTSIGRRGPSLFSLPVRYRTSHRVRRFRPWPEGGRLGGPGLRRYRPGHREGAARHPNRARHEARRGADPYPAPDRGRRRRPRRTRRRLRRARHPVARDVRALLVPSDPRRLRGVPAPPRPPRPRVHPAPPPPTRRP